MEAQSELRVKDYNTVVTGAEQFDQYLALLKRKKVAIVTNNTGVVGRVSIVDTLLHLGVKIVKIFGPEHGFRSNADAGQQVKSNKDPKTGLPIISLYGKNKKPTAEQLKHVDIVIYDIQDIGVRFYTYISTLTYVMEACARYHKPLIVLDRPNPNGFYIDGPVLKNKYRSFLGLHPVPIVYGMTCGEYAKMVNEEGWLSSDTAAFGQAIVGLPVLKCDLTVIRMKEYDRNSSYSLPIKPSPNIPNSAAVLLYPSLGLFEGTIMSLGRGTPMPFQVVGHPAFSDTSYGFTPIPGPISKDPRYVNQRCYGIYLKNSDYVEMHPHQLELRWLQRMYRDLQNANFFEKNFNYHAGNDELQMQLKEKMPLEQIRKSWQADLDKFKSVRVKYLLYADIR